MIRAKARLVIVHHTLTDQSMSSHVWNVLSLLPVFRFAIDIRQNTRQGHRRSFLDTTAG